MSASSKSQKQPSAPKQNSEAEYKTRMTKERWNLFLLPPHPTQKKKNWNLEHTYKNWNWKKEGKKKIMLLGSNLFFK